MLVLDIKINNAEAEFNIRKRKTISQNAVGHHTTYRVTTT